MMIPTNIVSSSYSPSVSKISRAATIASTRRSVTTVCVVVEVFLFTSLLLLLLCSENCGSINYHHAVVAAMTMGDVLDMSTTTYYENVPPHSYKEGEIVELKVNKLTSTKDLYPMDYYRLPYCTPVDGVQLDGQYLGQYLSGDRIQNSPYLIKMKTDMYCEQLCISNLGRAEQPPLTNNKFVKAIRNNYHNNWIVDNLPSASISENDETIQTRYWQGFPIGFINVVDKKAYVYNHVNIIIEYHADAMMKDAYRIVRFKVEPFSIAHEIGELAKYSNEFDEFTENYLPIQTKIISPIPSCDPRKTTAEHTIYDMLVDSGVKPQMASGHVLFTYDVIWKENRDVLWSSRWDVYISMDNVIPARVHWMSILDSMIIVVIMSAVLVCKWIATLRRSVPVANPYDYKLLQNDDDNETVEEVGWGAVRSDVFRPPSFSPMLLAVGCGTGAQLLCTTIVTAWLAYLGYLKAPNRGYLAICQFCSYSIFAIINGYVTARYYKAFDGKEQHRTTTIAAFGLPGIAFTFFMIIECIAMLKHSSYAVKFTIVFTSVLAWAGITVPLVFLGARWGYDQDAIEYPVATSSVPREIPKQRVYWYWSSPMTVGVSGILPFTVCFVELYYILSSIWMDYYYDAFGYLLIVIFLGSMVVVEQSIYCTYCQLNNEDYHWWWRAFWNGGAVGIYIFLYSIFGFFPQLESTYLESYILYFGYMGLVSLAVFAMMGFVGVSSSLYFNKVLYTSIKAE